MCGRFTLTAALPDVLNTFSVDEANYEYSPRYNIAPSQTIAVVADHDGRRVLEGYRWGLVPRWAKDIKIGFKMINARAETLDTKPTFRNLLARNRVIIPADGFFEWQNQGKEKQPFRFQLESKQIFGFAGLYDEWIDPEGNKLRSCTIITTRPNELVQRVHDRMPVILAEDAVNIWLDRNVSSVDQVMNMLQPYPGKSMIVYPVSRSVGNVRNTDSSLIEEVPLNSK
ncbi:SOS response-associated peptidase [Paenibacillus polymyxa]|uniref:SOS response-associated peptidase n=1 Tax=Paenibacillus polymyxa TaxID=1406 RepID=UPI0025B6A654|nr:SOS response-associated peptidase [Paenibacillus polymyxa]MDN4090941.1 SOS response-associated peptidase [Paenibacillus polymyxa]